MCRLRFLAPLTCLIVITVGPRSFAQAGDRDADYLQDGKLKEEVQLSRMSFLPSGAQSVGQYIVVEQDGSWRRGLLDGKTAALKETGKLTSEELNQFAQVLARSNLANLPSRNLEPPTSSTMIVFGTKSATFFGKAKSEDEEISARFAAIQKAMDNLCKTPASAPAVSDESPKAKIQVKVIQLKNISAASAAKVLQDLFPEQDGQTIRIVPESGSNLLVIRTNAHALWDDVAEVIRKIDANGAQQGGGRVEVRVYRLKDAKAAAVAKLLLELYSEKDNGLMLRVATEADTNTLVIRANYPGHWWDEMEAILAKMDGGGKESKKSQKTGN